MTIRSKQQLLPDLLRERRLELGLPGDTSAWQPTRPLLLLGGLIGCAAVLLSCGSIFLMERIEVQQREQLQTLSPVEQELQLVERRLRATQARVAAVSQDNLQIAERLVALPAGSPLLEQLRRVTPAGVQLEEVSVQNDRIKLSGKVGVKGTPGPLERAQFEGERRGDMCFAISGIKFCSELLCCSLFRWHGLPTVVG